MTLTKSDTIFVAHQKLADGWTNLNAHAKRSWLHIMKYEFGLTVQEIGVLLNMTNGQARYAWWKYGR